MDEVLTCRCGSQEWVIGYAGVRCSKCGTMTPGDFRFIISVPSMNKLIAIATRGRVADSTQPAQPAIALADLMEILHNEFPDGVVQSLWPIIKQRQQQA